MAGVDTLCVVVRYTNVDECMFPAFDATVGDLRQMVAKVRSLDPRPGGFDLLMRGDALGDEEMTLEHCGVEDGEVFEVVMGSTGRARQQLRDQYNVSDLKEGMERKLVDLCHTGGASPSSRRVNLELIRLLLQAGTDPNVKQYVLVPVTSPVTAPRQFNPHAIVSDGSLRFDESNLDASGNPYVVNMEASFLDSVVETGSGERPVHFAAINNDIRTLALLREFGADVNAVDHSNLTAMDHAISRGNLDAMTALKEWGVDLSGSSFLHMSVLSESMSAIKLLLSWGVSPDGVDVNGMTAMHLAVDNQRMPVMYVLHESGADVTKVDKDGWTAMHYALCDDNTAAMRALKEWGAPHNLVDVNGKEMIHIACDQHSVGAMCLLHEWGCNVNARDNDGRTPLHCAAKAGWQNPIELLIEWGADTKAMDHHGRSPTDMAHTGDNGVRRGTLSLTVLVSIAVMVPMAILFSVMAILYLG